VLSKIIHLGEKTRNCGTKSFDKMLKPNVGEVEDVSKMLAKEGDLYGGADGIRTHYQGLMRARFEYCHYNISN